MKRVHYCIPTYRAFEECKNSILSVLAGTRVPESIIVIDNSGNGSGALYLQSLVEQHTNIHIWPQDHNLGCSASWNMFHRIIDDDYIITANDDITLGGDAVEKLIHSAQIHEDDILFTAAGLAGNAYSLFLLKNKGYKHIGAFDEHFYPAYLEDNDYDRRRQLLGYNFILVPDITFTHVGSATIKKFNHQEMQQHHNSHRVNAEYYRSKWGGYVGQETYTEPFGGLL